MPRKSRNSRASLGVSISPSPSPTPSEAEDDVGEPVLMPTQRTRLWSWFPQLQLLLRKHTATCFRKLRMKNLKPRDRHDYAPPSLSLRLRCGSISASSALRTASRRMEKVRRMRRGGGRARKKNRWRFKLIRLAFLGPRSKCLFHPWQSLQKTQRIL